MTHVTIIDTGISNTASVISAFTRIGCHVSTTSSPDTVLRSPALVLPGVGAFEQGMKALREGDLIESILHRVNKDKVPIVGICLGMQLLADVSYENGSHAGLGIIPGNVVKLESQSADFRVPNIGWYDVISNKPSVMFDSPDQRGIFYHVHSYYLECTNSKDIAAHIDFDGLPITVAIESENIFGVQFHPEKSQGDGLNLLSRIVRSFDV